MRSSCIVKIDCIHPILKSIFSCNLDLISGWSCSNKCFSRDQNSGLWILTVLCGSTRIFSKVCNVFCPFTAFLIKKKTKLYHIFFNLNQEAVLYFAHFSCQVHHKHQTDALTVEKCCIEARLQSDQHSLSECILFPWVYSRCSSEVNTSWISDKFVK